VSRDDVAHWLGDHWGKALIAGALTVGLYVGRLEGKISRMDERVSDAEVYRATVTGIGRLVCVADPDKAALAGIPCDILLNKGAR
jgi:hypothetical protein